MIRPLLAALSMVVGLQAHASDVICVPAIVTLKDGDQEVSVSLNRDGSWMIGDWRAVERMADQTTIFSQVHCIAEELIKHKRSIVVNNDPDQSCDGDWEAAGRDNSILRACEGLPHD